MQVIESNFLALGPAMVRHRIAMDWSFLRIHRTHLMLDASLVNLEPDIDYQELAREYFRQAAERRLRHLLHPEILATSLGQWLSLVTEVPGFIQEQVVLRGALSRRQGIQRPVGKYTFLFELLFKRLSQLAWFGLILGTAAMLRQHPPDFLASTVQKYPVFLDRVIRLLGIRSWLVLLGGLFLALRTFRTLQKRFSTRDIQQAER